MKPNGYAITIAIALFSTWHCGSLVGETDRIRAQYNAQNAPFVIATDPGDNSIGPYNQTYIDITFSTTLDVATVTAQANFGACSGSFQVSYDGFANCLGGSIDASANPRIRFVPAIFPKGLGLQIRTSSANIGSNEAPAKPYTSPVGFKLAAPCGNQNCFFSYSTPLVHQASTRSGIFRINSGAHAGKYLVYSASGTATTLIDVQAGKSESGPSICYVPTNGSADFYIATGTHAGKQLVFRGAGTPNTCFYDPTLGTFTTVGAPNLSLGANNGAFVVQPRTGSDQDNTLIFRGGGNEMLRYTAAGGTVTTSGQVVATSISDRAHAVLLSTGSDVGKYLVFVGSGTNSTSLLDPTAGAATLTGSALTSAALGAGALSFEVTTGSLPGRVITALGGSAATSVFSTSALGVVGAAGPSLASGNTGNGALLLRQTGNISETRPLILHGGANAHATSYFDADNNVFVVGPVTTGAIGTASASAWVPAVDGAGGGFLIVNGLAGYSTSVYLPHNNTFHGSRMPLSVPNAGAHAFRITGGAHDGKTMIVAAGGTRHTAIYDPVRHTMIAGVDLVNSATTTSLSVPLTQGPYAGNVLTFLGGGSFVFNVYNAASNQFLTSGAAGLPTSGSVAAINTGATAFPVSGSAQILIVRGNGTSTHVFDQSTGGIAAGPLTSCTVNSVPANTQFRTSAGLVKQAIYGQASQVTVFDHAAMNFVTATLTAPGGAGLQMYTIPSGPEAGNILVIHGGGTAGTSIINRDTLIASAGPPVSGVTACGNTAVVNDGAQLLPIPYGPNAGKAVLLIGGSPTGSPVYCLYDPSTNSFGSAAVVDANGSPGFAISNGSVAFRTNGGVYPTGFVVLSGANKNVWSTYVP